MNNEDPTLSHGEMGLENPGRLRYVREDLKRDINELVWQALPGWMPLARAEYIAGQCYVLIADAAEEIPKP